MEPYHYTVDGTDHLITSIAVPIIVDGRTVGVLGLDTALNGLSDSFGAMRPYGTGTVAIISNGGLIVEAPNAAHLGDRADKLSASLAGVQPRVAAGEAFRQNGRAGVTNAEAVEIFVPIRVGEARPWSVVVSLPNAALMAPARRMAFYAAGVSVALLGVLALLVTQITRSLISGPVRRLAGSVEGVTSGNTDTAIPLVDRADELGVMARAIDLFRRNLIEVATLHGREAEGKAAADAEKRRTLAALADTFESNIRGVVEAVTEAAGQLGRQCPGTGGGF